jgi:hypothetical protein
MSNDAPKVEYLGPELSGTSRSKGRKRGLAAVAAVGVLAVAGGAYGVAQFMSGGEAAATAVPDNALLYLSLDLDPPGDQKLEVLETLRKFPAIKEDLGLGSQDDLRRWVFEAVTKEAPCDDLDFGRDVEPWLGSRVAVSVVPGEDEPLPFGVVQVKDEEAATAGLAALAECGDADAPGSAFVGDYMIVAETDALAEGIAADAGDSALADDDEFTRWVDEAGGSGIVTGYVAAAAPEVLLAEIAEGRGMPSHSDSGLYAGRAPALQDFEDPGMMPMLPGVPDPAQLEKALEDFEGAAVSVRFDDAALELELAAGGPDQPAGTGGSSGLGELPSTTAVGLGTGIPEGAVQQMFEGLSSALGAEPFDAMVAQAESQTGLSLPEDLQTLLGEGLSVAVDSSADFGALSDGTGDPTALPVGVRITGDPDAIVPVLEKVLAAAGAEAVVTVESGDGVVAVGLAPEHVAELARDGDLGEQDAFARALPDYDGTAGGLYVDFDAGDWLTELVEGEPDADRARENLEPLNSLGVSGTTEDGETHGLVRLSTD